MRKNLLLENESQEREAASNQFIKLLAWRQQSLKPKKNNNNSLLMILITNNKQNK